MSRSFQSSSLQYLQGSLTPPVTGVPFTISCWANCATTASNKNVIVLGNSTGDAYYVIYLNNPGAGNVSFVSQDGLAERFVTATATFTANTWFHIGVTAVDNTTRSVFLNGGNKGTASISSTPSGISIYNVGAYRVSGGSIFSPFDGRIAEVAMWNTVLGDDEIAALARGVNPLRIQKSAMRTYNPLWGISSPEPDMSGNGQELVVGNGSIRGNHAPVSMLTRYRTGWA
jgi:hypothetical protein